MSLVQLLWSSWSRRQKRSHIIVACDNTMTISSSLLVFLSGAIHFALIYRHLLAENRAAVSFVIASIVFNMNNGEHKVKRSLINCDRAALVVV